MPHPSMLLSAAATGAHLDLSAQDFHPRLLLVLMKTVIQGGGHLTVKGTHPNMMSKLAQVGGKHLMRKW
jgi:hypothetical protein